MNIKHCYGFVRMMSNDNRKQIQLYYPYIKIITQNDKIFFYFSAKTSFVIDNNEKYFNIGFDLFGFGIGFGYEKK